MLFLHSCVVNKCSSEAPKADNFVVDVVGFVVVVVVVVFVVIVFADHTICSCYHRMLF